MSIHPAPLSALAHALRAAAYLLACLLACLGASLPAAARECERVLITADPAYPPLHWYDGQTLRGASIDLTVEVLQRLKLPYEVRYLGPLNRVMRAAQAGEVDMVVTLKDTPERREFLSYPATPAFVNPIAVFVHRARSFSYHGPEDLRGRAGGMAAGNRMAGAEGQRLMDELKIEQALDASANFRKLQLGRIDYFITGLYTGLATLSTRPDGADFMALRPYLQESFNYTPFVKASPCAVHLLDFDRELRLLLRTGAAERILSSNLEAWRSKPVVMTAPTH
ncbi:transporter substrate-binding domain-containing protein [Paucibacter sediminis]|uniref:Transporter substrate-binding domain-containing protein n=1 Tax=Paucibacter sediminis TaxID=3019553 RepID=A0AA95NH58_9BURK|nr:transporter substrate-binding domain-containing protein [Paucibacter sp. S2-9]WIT12224.1 transporter substrate-binding domain-containing protein [Paucibacter sp. S2-9]